MRAPTLTSRGQACIACGVVLVGAGLALGFIDLTRVGVLLMGIPGLGWLLTRRGLRGLRVTREFRPARITPGERCEVTLSVENAGSRPTPPLVVVEHVPRSLGPNQRLLFSGMAARQRRTATYRVHGGARGPHRIGPLGVMVRDPFGMSQRALEVGSAHELIVLPRVVPLQTAVLAGLGGGHDGEIPHVIALHGEDDQTVREYRDGDDLRRVHWPATARTGNLMVRQEDRPSRRRATVVLDSRADAHRGAGRSSSFEWAVSACASVVTMLADRGYAVHLVTRESATDGGQAADQVDGREAVERLARVTVGPTRDHDQVLHVAERLASSGGLVVAVVAAHDTNALRTLAMVRPVGAAGIALVIDAGAFAGASATSVVGSFAAGLTHVGRERSRNPDAAVHLDLLRQAGWTAAIAGRHGDTIDAIDHVWRSAMPHAGTGALR